MVPCVVPVGRRIVSRIVAAQKRAGKLSGRSKELETEKFACATDRLYDLGKLKLSVFSSCEMDGIDTPSSPWD